MAAGQQNPGFYTKAKSGFTIDIKSREVQNFNIYPDAWQPKKDGDWVGQSRPFLAVTSKNNVIGILPKIGDQLFFFQLKGNGLIPTGETLVNHPDRKRDLAFDPEDESLLYPSFFDLKAGGSFFLIHFYTEVPKDRYLPMKAQGTNNAKNPEFLELLRETRRSKYILVDERGNQAPVLSLPIEGQVHYIDADDIIYIKPVTKDERDYNVFYRYRVKM